jgi:lycopene cyclase domain-containing protein
MKFTYLLVDLLSVCVPLAFSFESKLQFYRKWKALLPAIVIPGVLFLVWDSFFTALGVWGFNDRYITGIKLYNLPIEEVLFFICIPYCCVFTYEVLNHFVKRDVLGKSASHAAIVLMFMLSAVSFWYSDRAYTFSTSVLTSLFLFVHVAVLKKPYWSRLVFAYLIILVPFFITNGILTGTGLPEPVVWYNNAENLGIRMFTIPVEDTLYGFLLIGLNISFYEFFKTK